MYIPRWLCVKLIANLYFSGTCVCSIMFVLFHALSRRIGVLKLSITILLLITVK